MTHLSPPPTIKEAARLRTRLKGKKKSPLRKVRPLKTDTAKRENLNRRSGEQGTYPHSGEVPSPTKLGESERTSLKRKLYYKKKYKDKVLTDFDSWSDIQKKFLYDHSIIYREDRDLRQRFMKLISDTANTYMHIRKTFGFREYDWQDNPHLFLHMGLSKTVWRSAVKRLVDCKVSRLIMNEHAGNHV